MKRIIAILIVLVSAAGSLFAAGEHVLKIWRVDPGFVLEKIIVDTGDLSGSYLGPPESPCRPAAREASTPKKEWYV